LCFVVVAFFGLVGVSVDVDAFTRPMTTFKLTTRSSTRVPVSSTFAQSKNTCLFMSESSSSSKSSSYDFALLFDCDGVILETEELHRLAYNEAFEAAQLLLTNPNNDEDDEPVVWSVEYYDILQNTVGGGKPKMFYHFTTTTGGKWPSYIKRGEDGDGERQPPPRTLEEQQALVDDLQAHKTQIYRTYIEEKATPRPGVLQLMDEALDDPTIAVGVCSASTKEAVTKVLDVTLGQSRVSKLDVCILGDDVSAKKPDPMIYNEARRRLKIDDPLKCVVVEDSMVGLRAAKSAGMNCIITYTSSTENEDFYGEGADAKVPDLASRRVTLQSIFGPLREKKVGGSDGIDLLAGIKDPSSTAAVPAAETP
jgi:HAD superfamily hydrolase (TIGR01509 family)